MIDDQKMTDPANKQKRLLIGLSASLGAALLVIAFLVGRMTVAPVAPGPAAEAHPKSTSDTSAVPSSTSPANPQAAPTLSDRSSTTPAGEQSSQPSYSLAPSTGSRTISSPSATKEAITSYFAKMDSIQVAGSGDTTSFAQGILEGIKGGDLSRVDELVKSAKSALTQARSVQPPPPCAEYHSRLLAVLSDSVTGMEQFRTALQNNDSKAMLSLAARFQSKQQELDRLEALKKQLLAG